MRYVMGTFLDVNVQGSDLREAQEAQRIIFNEIQELEERLSIYKQASEVSQINHAAGLSPVHVSPKTFAVIEQALHYAKLSDGAFDPTLNHIRNYRHVQLNAAAQAVFLLTAGMRLDLGGIGKGFALDCALERVKGIPSLTKITINFGGQLLFWTPSGTFDPISIAIEDPENRNAVLTTLQITTNGSLSTSSNAERAMHMQDPRSQEPVIGMSSVTVLAPTATQAEALSTAFFVLPPEQASALLNQCPGARAYVFKAIKHTLKVPGTFKVH
jgi:thiamine biosynthesis lipoprotein